MTEGQLYPEPMPMGSITALSDGSLALRGSLTREPAYPGHTGHYGALREAIDSLAGKADRLILDIDCCGGDVAGLTTLCHHLRNSPVHLTAHITGLCASAAYYIAAACDEIEAEVDAVIGSIGSYVDAPVPPETIRVSSRTPLKLAGGDAIQPLADDAGDRFLLDVAAFRGFDTSDVDEIADQCGRGALMTSSEALKRHLIDRITPTDAMEVVMADEITDVVEEITETPPAEGGDEMDALLEKLIEKLMPKLDEIISSKIAEQMAPSELVSPEEGETVETVVEEGAKGHIDRAARADVKRLQFALLRKDGKLLSADDEAIASRIYDLDRGLFRRIYDSGAKDLLTRFSSSAAPRKTEGKTLDEKIDAYLAAHRGVGYKAAKAAVERGMK